MSKVSLILGFILLTILIASDLRDFLTTDEGVRYFTSEPRRFVYVVAIALIGGALALLFSRLSPITRRKITLVMFGGFAACFTGLVVLFATLLPSISFVIAESGKLPLIFSALVLAIAAVALIWFEFYLFWRRSKSCTTNL